VVRSGEKQAMGMTKEHMPETLYRASRFCRVLGNPTAYLILRSLGSSRKTPSELSRELHIRLTTMSMTLRHLRQMDLVRYQTREKTKEYWVKERKILGILGAIETWVDATRAQDA
jgi:DNA-binding HxlR family transcriptional regulator